MKRMSNPLLRSKSALLFVLVAAGIALAIPACKKDDKNSNSNAVSQTEVAQVVTTAVTSGGVVAQTNSASASAMAYLGARKGAKTADCGYTSSGEFNYPTSTNNNYTIGFYYSYNYKVACGTDNQTYTYISFDFNGRTTFASDKISLSDTSAAKFLISGLSDDSTNLIFNQTYDHSGNYTSTTGNSFHSVIHYTATNVTVNKSTLQIVSGTATLKITGVTTTGKSFSYEGTIVYKGNNKAVFTITGGGSFDLTW